MTAPAATPSTSIRFRPSLTYFGTTPDYWINLQARYDLEAARDAWESRIASEVKPRQAV
jgi:plasmid maintenance system antidote protein VapI